MDFLQSVGLETLATLELAAPFLLFGLLVAGFLHVLMPSALIERWLGSPGMSGVVRAALIGVPLPVCSCGVVPIAVEMRRKGASPPASLSFLTTTPESSADSILFTWGLMGPVMAIARPVAAFFTALLGGALAIVFPPEDRLPEAVVDSAHGCCESDCSSTVDQHASEALASLAVWRRGESFSKAWSQTLRPALHYGFVELLDDLAFWLLLGVVLAGLVGVAVPADLAERGLGSGLMPMLLMLVIGVPIYMCASASTPVAAALMAKGVGPGAALVFLLAGPATNVATIVLLSRTFGRRFVQIYLLSVVAGALAAGLVLEALIAAFGFEILLPSGDVGHSAMVWIEQISFAVLAVLLLASLWRGSGRSGWRELRAGFAGIRY